MKAKRSLQTSTASQPLENEHQRIGQRYRQFVERVPALVVELAPDWTIRFANPAFLISTGYTQEELAGKNWREMFLPGEMIYQATEFDRAEQAEEPSPFEMTLTVKGDGDVTKLISVELSLERQFSPDGSLDGITLFGSDITERKAIEAELLSNLEALRISEEELRIQNESLIQAQDQIVREHQRYQALFTFAPDGYLVTDQNGVIQEANQAAAIMLQRHQHFLIGKPLVVYIDRVDHGQFYLQLHRLKTGEKLVEWETTIHRGSGEPLPISVTIGTVRNERDQIVSLRWIVHDISRRKGIETELRELRRRIMDSTEAERLHLARELHDGPLQELLAITYRLESLRMTLSDENALSQLEAMKGSLQVVIQNLRDTAGQLRPPTLAPFGLEKALRSHAGVFQEAHPEIRIRLDLMPDGQTLPELTRLALFRICQQGLVNVIRHAEATQVDIRFHLDENEIRLEIQDNGRGFIIPNRWITLARQGHLGLAGAAERAEAIGGKLQVESSPGEGTLLRVTVPRAAVH